MTIKKIKKRSGEEVDYDLSKIIIAIEKAMKNLNYKDVEEAKKIAKKVDKNLTNFAKTHIWFIPDVEYIQDMVELEIMRSWLYEVAKAYITYRQKRIEERKRNIFKPRTNIKPYEYGELLEYVDAIRHSYWVHTEFSFTSDIQDFKINVNESERNAIKNAMLAIAQIEVNVKTFWWDIYKQLPKPEIGSVGATFSESEVRHMDAYSHLLELLWMNNEFEKIREIPALNDRVEYLSKAVVNARSEDKREYSESILLFSLFIEHVSLFSQFLIIMSFNKYKNIFKWISNVVEATSKEEQIHWLFGIEIINIIKKENPDWFDDTHNNHVKRACLEAFEAESKLIDWIFEAWEVEFLPKKMVIEFIKNRLNNSLESIWLEKIFEIDEKLVEQTDWFDDEIMSTKHWDFFVKRSVNYNKRSKAITSDDLF